MPLERDGFLTLVEDRTYDGVRTSASESVRRYTLLRNGHIFNRDAITKDRGIRRIHSTDIGGGADILGGFDAHFQGGTQRLVVVNTSDAHVFNTTTGEFDAQSLSLANARPDQFMFADKMLLMNGTDFKSLTSAGTWTTVSGSPPAAKFGTVHAARACVAGVVGSEHIFYPSGIRDETDWDNTLGVIVDSAEYSSGLTNLGRLGPYMIVQTSQSTHAYVLNADNPRDWDNFDISNRVGILNHRSWVEVDRSGMGDSISYAFFWGDDGPYMLAQGGGSRPALFGLMDPIMRSVRGEAYQSMPALDPSRYAYAEAAYVPEFGQVRFGLSKFQSTENDIVLWVDVDSAVAFAAGQLEYPFWGVRDNTGLGYFPCDTMFTARVGTSGAPSTTGQDRCFGCRNGIVFEMDAPSTYEDNGEPIPLEVRRRGYDGAQEGVRAMVKGMRHIRVRSTQAGNAELYADLIADGGNDTATATLPLGLGLTAWGGTTWGGGNWNAGEFRTLRGDVGVNGERFELRLYDNGNINAPFQIDGWQIEGWVEDRR